MAGKRATLWSFAILFGFAALVTPLAADPAIVITNGELCSMPGADADGNIIVGGFGTAIVVLENDRKVMIKCLGTGITNLSGKSQTFSGFVCGISVPSGGVVSTTDTHATVSPKGVATMMCTYTKP